MSSFAVILKILCTMTNRDGFAGKEALLPLLEA